MFFFLQLHSSVFESGNGWSSSDRMTNLSWRTWLLIELKAPINSICSLEHCSFFYQSKAPQEKRSSAIRVPAISKSGLVREASSTVGCEQWKTSQCEFNQEDAEWLSNLRRILSN